MYLTFEVTKDAHLHDLLHAVKVHTDLWLKGLDDDERVTLESIVTDLNRAVREAGAFYALRESPDPRAVDAGLCGPDDVEVDGYFSSYWPAYERWADLAGCGLVDLAIWRDGDGIIAAL